MARREHRVAVDRKPPRNAEARIRAWAGEGATQKGIARSLGVSDETLTAWMDRHPELRAAMDEGREAEHKVLHNALFRAAEKGNVTAAIFLLKTRHGYREGDQTGIANKVSVTFNVPGAMSLDQFKGRTIEPADD
ncbi:hypothetical protein ABQJ54_03755 [Rhodanobacter sp. Si-c]|uniref:Helix-turn-helix domain-containing protein n=1 Tax=Rhodanobacter lycopersici TaxID=3162487 RepID=A0ABV3QAP2_9GAMM